MSLRQASQAASMIVVVGVEEDAVREEVGTIVALRPDLLGPADVFRRNVSAYAEAVRATRPIAGGGSVRMPFDRSRAERARRLREGVIEVEETIVAVLRGIADA